MKSTLIIYYSLNGNTRLIAETIAQTLSADLLELKPKKDLNPQGFMRYLWGGRQVIQKEKPELEPITQNWSEYPVIIFGTPVWAFSFAPAIRSFLSENKIEGKHIALFCTHEGGQGKTLMKLATELQNNTIISQTDFFCVQQIPAKNIAKATNWAKEIQTKISAS